jgi:hypothetical protein
LPRAPTPINHAEELPDDRLPPENPLDLGAGSDDPDDRDEPLLPPPNSPDDPELPDELDDDRNDPDDPPAFDD